jgi:hypothetical protein
MPRSCHEFLRLMILDSLFTGPKKKWIKAELLEKVNSKLQGHTGRSSTAIAMRTLELDIQKMRHGTLGVHAPIEYRGGFYAYANPEFSLQSALLPKVVIRQLKRLGKSLPELLNTREVSLEIQEMIIEVLESLGSLLGDHPAIFPNQYLLRESVNHAIAPDKEMEESLKEWLVDRGKKEPLASPAFDDALPEAEVNQASESLTLRPSDVMKRPSRRISNSLNWDPEPALKWGDLFALLEKIDWKRQAA